MWARLGQVRSQLKNVRTRRKKTIIVLLMTIGISQICKKIKQFVKGNYNCDYYFEK